MKHLTDIQMNPFIRDALRAKFIEDIKIFLESEKQGKDVRHTIDYLLYILDIKEEDVIRS